MIVLVILASVRIYREGLARSLEEHARARVVATVGTVSEAIDSIVELSPDAVLVDALAPNGLAAAESLAEAQHGLPLVGLAVPEEDAAVVACAEAGVCGFVPPEGSLEDVVVAAECAARGETACSPRIAAALLRRVATMRNADDSVAHAAFLTARERQILTLIDEGLSNKEIATRLCIEVSTVKNHVHRILNKLGVHRRSQAAARVRQSPGSHG